MNTYIVVINIQLQYGAGFIALLVLTAMGCGMRNLCRRRGRDEDEVSSAELSLAASSHGLVKEDCAGAGLGLRPCMNCILIGA